MGKYLDILDRAGICDISDQSDKSPPFGRLNRFGRTFSALETRCPELVPVDRWQPPSRMAGASSPAGASRQRRWAGPPRTVRPPPAAGDATPELQPPVSIRRDWTDLAAAGPAGRRADRGTAAIQSSTGAITIYRRHNKPALGPPGDCLDDLEPPFGPRRTKATAQRLTIVAKHSVTRMPSVDTICTKRHRWPLRHFCVFWLLPRGAIWEPACGRGAIANVLRAHGHRVICTDLVDYGADSTAIYGVDFLRTTELPADVGCILTNPPFKIINKFIDHALRLCPQVIILARLALWESERRSSVLEGRWAKTSAHLSQAPSDDA